METGQEEDVPDCRKLNSDDMCRTGDFPWNSGPILSFRLHVDCLIPTVCRYWVDPLHSPRKSSPESFSFAKSWTGEWSDGILQTDSCGRTARQKRTGQGSDPAKETR